MKGGNETKQFPLTNKVITFIWSHFLNAYNIKLSFVKSLKRTLQTLASVGRWAITDTQQKSQAQRRLRHLYFEFETLLYKETAYSFNQSAYSYIGYVAVTYKRL